MKRTDYQIILLIACALVVGLSLNLLPIHAQYNCSYYNEYCCGYYYYNCYGYCPYYSYYCNYGTYGYQTTTTTQTLTQFNTTTQTVTTISPVFYTQSVTVMVPTIDRNAIYQATMPLYLVIGGLVALLFAAMLLIWGLFAKYDVTSKSKEVT